MNKTSASSLLSSMDFRTKWVFLGLVAWIIIPWKGLEYGLFESSGSEILNAFAWKSFNTSLISLAVFLLFLLRPWKSHLKANLIDAAISIATFIIILFGAGLLNESLGYSAAIQLTFFLLK